MGTQHHVIQRQIVEITLAKKENAWELQQALSRIFRQSLPPLLDQCLSEAGNPDYLHRIDRLELDLGALDSNNLEADILNRIELTLRQALREQIDYTEVTQQKNDFTLSHVELLEHFVREGYLPWWADSSQRQLPEKSFAVLLNSDPDVLKQLLSGLAQESRCLQRLISYFDDSRLAAILSLLTGTMQSSSASLVQILSAAQAPLHQLSRMPLVQVRAALWKSLLQVAMTGTPVISRHAEFLTAVTVRWAKLQGLSHKVLVGCLEQLASSRDVTNNEWLQAVRRSAAEEPALVMPAEELIGEGYATADTLRLVHSHSSEEITAASLIANTVGSSMSGLRPTSTTISSRYEILKKMRSAESRIANQMLAVSDDADAVSSSQPKRQRLASAAVSRRKSIVNKLSVTPSKASDEPAILGQAADSLSKPVTGRYRSAAAISGRYPKLNKLRFERLKSMNESSIAEKNPNLVTRPMIYRPQFDPVASNKKAGFDNPEATRSKPTNELVTAEQVTVIANPMSNRYRLFISNRYATLKGRYSTDRQKTTGEALAEGIQIKQPVCALAHSSQPNRLPAKNNSPENRATIERHSARSTFSDTDTIYIDNAGFCILWPFFSTFFERLELMQNGRFYNASAKQCAVSLLHYLAFAELDPPEYLLPFNKLLCAMEIDEVFDLETPLTTAQVVACDELLEAVIGKAPILSDMSINGFRGSFLLRRGSLSAGEGSWLLRVERETYDVVLERFPWSWQWFKLPWMEYPIRVEW